MRCWFLSICVVAILLDCALSGEVHDKHEHSEQNETHKEHDLPEDKKNWWKKIIIYQIYPRSFMDSNGDGIGDLNGITKKLDYIKEVGFGAAWLSPVYKSPQKDFGYDVENFTSIDPIFGSLDDFDRLVSEAKQRGLKILMDFVPNHTSNTSVWFQKSERKEEPFTDFYVWVDGKGPDKNQPPNNWLSMFGGPAWQWSPIRKQFYYHQFVVEQPDLNYRNPKVREAMKDVLRFWLKRGVVGFRIDAVKHLFEDAQLRDEPPSHDPTAKSDEYNSLKHIYTTSDPQVMDVVAEWRDVLDEFEKQDGLHRLMMLEINETVKNTVAYYGNESHPLSDVPFNFELFKIDEKSTTKEIYELIKDWLDGVGDQHWPNWIIGNHDHSRIANRTREGLIDAFNMINLLLKGTPITYYGEEIGMVDRKISWEDTRDPFGLYYGKDRYEKFSRDPVRTPMQWNKETNAGFTTGEKPWLPVNENYKEGLNVHEEKKDPRSHLSTFHQLQQLRSTTSGESGQVIFPVVTNNILSFARVVRGNPDGILVIINFGKNAETVDFVTKGKTEGKDFEWPKHATVKAASRIIPSDSPLALVNSKISLSEIHLAPDEAVALQFHPKWKN